MSNSIANTLIDSLFDTINLAAKLIFNKSKSKDLDYFFQSVSMKNKLNEYPIVINNKGSYVVKVPIGLNINDFYKIQDSLETYLNYTIEMNLDNQYLKITKSEKQELPNFINYCIPTRDDKEGIFIPIGYTFNNEPIVINLKSNPHSVVSGVTGGGKSVCVKSMITSLMNNYSSDEINFYFIDFKIVELSLFKRCTDYVKSYVTEIDEAKELLADLMEECKRRYKLFDELEVTNIWDYNKLVPKDKQLEKQIIIIEEFVELTQDKKKIAMTLLKRFSSLARASGQFLICTGQRFDNTVIDLVLRNNLSNRIIFQMSDEANSKLLLGISGAENINIKGRCYVKVNGDIKECQSYYISDNEVKEIIKPYIKKKSSIDGTKTELNQNININDKLVTKHIETATNPNDKVTDITEKNKILDLSFIDNL